MLTLSQSNGEGGCKCCEVGFCHDALGDNLDVVISGILLGSCFASSIDGQVSVIASIGINGVFLATWDEGLQLWIVVIGTLTLQKWNDVDCTIPNGDPFDVEITLSIFCHLENSFIVTAQEGVGISTGNRVVFTNDAEDTDFGDPIPNLQVGPGLSAYGFDGVITLSEP